MTQWLDTTILHLIYYVDQMKQELIKVHYKNILLSFGHESHSTWFVMRIIIHWARVNNNCIQILVNKSQTHLSDMLKADPVVYQQIYININHVRKRKTEKTQRIKSAKVRINSRSFKYLIMNSSSDIKESKWNNT